MKRWLLAALMMLLFCSAALGEGVLYRDGVYRGFYYQDGREQVAVQFEIKGGLFKSVVLRSLTNRWGNLLDEDADKNQKEKLAHFNVLCDYLEGKEIDSINDLYYPDEILLSAGYMPNANVPYEKLLSAMWDGLNRRPFKLVNTSKLPEALPYPDGIYMGRYSDADGEQVVLLFAVAGNRIKEIHYEKLEYKGIDYMASGAGEDVKKIARQFEQLIEYLVGKDLSAVNDLYQPGNIAQDTDVSSAATLRAPKVISAIWEGLNKNAYTID